VMRIRWDNIWANEQKQFDKMNEYEKFVYFLLLQFGSPYGWGQETPEAADCSGGVCLALYGATGLLIRTTADDLYKRLFTRKNPSKNDISAVFFITKKQQIHVDRTVAAGTAVHVAGIVGDGIVLNAQEPYAKVRRISELSDYYQRNGHEVAICGLNREALVRLAAEGKTVYGLDANFRRYFES